MSINLNIFEDIKELSTTTTTTDIDGDDDLLEELGIDSAITNTTTSPIPSDNQLTIDSPKFVSSNDNSNVQLPQYYHLMIPALQCFLPLGHLISSQLSTPMPSV